MEKEQDLIASVPSLYLKDPDQAKWSLIQQTSGSETILPIGCLDYILEPTTCLRTQ